VADVDALNAVEAAGPAALPLHLSVSLLAG
jgi:hypothetical protein